MISSRKQLRGGNQSSLNCLVLHFKVLGTPNYRVACKSYQFTCRQDLPNELCQIVPVASKQLNIMIIGYHNHVKSLHGVYPAVQ